MRFDSLAESEQFPIVPWLLFWDRELPPGLEGKHWVHQRSVSWVREVAGKAGLWHPWTR